MKKLITFLTASVVALAVVRCSEADPSATSPVTLSMAAVTAGAKIAMGGRLASSGRTASDSVSLNEVTVNVRDIKFEFDKGDHHFHEPHFKRDSCFGQADDNKLEGPYLVNLMAAGEFVDQVITTADLPNATYEGIRFKLAPSQEAGTMQGKSIYISGKLGASDFVFWHNRDAGFGMRLRDSTSVATTSDNAILAINLELEKVLNALNGGVDLTGAVDGNNDGVITIDPDDTDGNRLLADQIMMMLGRHGHFGRKDH